MIRLFCIALLGAVLSLVPCAPATASGMIHARYLGIGPIGTLELVGAGGCEFAAIDAAGRFVAGGYVPADLHLAPVFLAAPGPLQIHVSGHPILVVDRDGMWE
jgi:hypothetical protein